MSTLPRPVRGSFYVESIRQTAATPSLAPSITSKLVIFISVLLFSFLPAMASDEESLHSVPEVPSLEPRLDYAYVISNDRSENSAAKAPARKPRTGSDHRRSRNRFVLSVYAPGDMAKHSRMVIGMFESKPDCRRLAGFIVRQLRVEFPSWRTVLFQCRRTVAGETNIQSKVKWMPRADSKTQQHPQPTAKYTLRVPAHG